MNIDEIEALIRQYLSAGITVIIAVISPGTASGAGDAPPWSGRRSGGCSTGADGR